MRGIFSPSEIVKSGLCIGCGSCAAQALMSGTIAGMKSDPYGNLKPSGPADWYKKPSETFSSTCPFSPVASNEDQLSATLFGSTGLPDSSIGRHIINYAGFVKEDDFRMNGSSGGMVTWTASRLMHRGLINGVAHVIPSFDPQEEDRFFRFRISMNEEEIRSGAKSRYYPVEMSEVLHEIARVPGTYAFVAVPCMIKAVNLLKTKYPVFRERISFTLGLFCGHMKSSRFVESFAWQMKVPLSEIISVDFRYKYPDRPANWYNAMLNLRNGSSVNRDWWHFVDGDWGAGFFMNPACNFCDDVVAETADISFGDAWVEPYTSDWKGTNVVIVRSPVLRDIVKEGINEGGLELKEVDAAFVANTQAAGLRQRREGLSYRLTWAVHGIKPEKRVPPSKDLSKERKRIYRMRYKISARSHRLFRLSAFTGIHFIYLFWARIALSSYYSRAYHKGKFSYMKKRFIQLSGKQS